MADDGYHSPATLITSGSRLCKAVDPPTFSPEGLGCWPHVRPIVSGEKPERIRYYLRTRSIFSTAISTFSMAMALWSESSSGTYHLQGHPS